MQRIEKQLQRTRETLKKLREILPSLNDDTTLEGFRPTFDLLTELRGIGGGGHPQSGAPAVNQSDLNAFTKWFEDGRGALSGVVPRAGLPEGTGLIATRDIADGDVIVKVPYSLMMTEETAALCPSRSALGLAAPMFPEVDLALHVLHEKLALHSAWAPYIKVLPKSFSTPLYWTWDELCALRGSPTLTECLSCLRTTATQYCHLFKELDGANKGERFIALHYFTYSEFVWAISVLMTRKNRVPRQSPATPPASASSSAAPQQSADMLALIPMWDMCNHAEGKVTTFAEDSGSVCRAMKGFGNGEQVYMHYGDRPSMQLFSHNGFVVSSVPGPHDIVLIKNRAQLSAGRKKILDALVPHDKSGYAFFVSSASREPSPALSSLLFAVSVPEPQVAAWTPERKPEDADAERARKALAEMCAWHLKQYPTTAEEDIAVLKKSGATLSPVTRCAVMLRLQEKRVYSALAGVPIAEESKEPLQQAPPTAAASESAQGKQKSKKGSKKKH